MKKISLLLISFLLFSIHSIYADAGLPDGQGYKIKIKIDGLQDTSIYLGYHFGEKKYVTDTIMLDSKGNGVFEGPELLDGGIYLIVLPSKTYFEIIIDKDQQFNIEADTAILSKDYLRSVKISGSDENTRFYKYQIFMSDQNIKATELRKALQDNKDDTKKTEKIKLEIEELDKEVKDFWKNIKEEHSSDVLAAILRGLTEIEVPEAPVDSVGNIIDSTFRYRFYKEHYFDNIDFSDRRILRTPVYHNKIKYFFERVVLQHPDSLIVESNRIINYAKADSLMFQYTVQYLFNLYNSSNIMGFDQIFVDISEKYYLSGQATWADSAFLAKIEERVIKLKPNLLGQKAPNLKMISPDGQYYSLHDIEAKAIILYFWDPDCGHCKKVIPKLHSYYQEVWDQGVEVFAVYTQIDLKEWTEFINEKGINDWINVYDPYGYTNFRTNYDIYSTPVAYVLDVDKNIIAKRIDLDTLKKLLEEEIGIKSKSTNTEDSQDEK